MNSTIATWPRGAFEAGGQPNVFQLFCFAPGPLQPDLPMSAARFGLPDETAMQFVEVRELARAIDPAWFDGFRSGALRSVAQLALGDLSALDAVTQLTAVLITRPDAADLRHLQAGWAVAQWLVARGVTVVLDAQTNRFWKGAEIADWPAARPFMLSTDVNVVVEADPLAPSATIHTRGLQKFGRPDLVTRDVPAAAWDATGALLRALAGHLAQGRVLKPSDTVNLGEHRVTLAAFRPTPQTDLHLNNEALLVRLA